jgi:predicted metal-dependent hydrolase
MAKTAIELKGIEFIVKYKRRQDILLTVDRGDIGVAVPKNMPLSKVERFLEENFDFILKYKERDVFAALGGSILFNGKEHLLETVIYDDAKERLRFDGNHFIFENKTENQVTIKRLIIEFLKEKTLEMIGPRIDHYKSLVGVSPGEIKVEKMFGRWAACSNFGNMKFHWKCAMLPDDILDYVVVHELCHLIHLNHGPEYWQKVESVMPDYHSKKEWLEKEGLQIMMGKQ